MNLHVERRGGGRDLVLLHGWGLHSGVWDEVATALATGFTVHAVDLPGHGRSAGMPAGAFDDAVDALARVVPADAAVCGWSLGALFALRLARRHPGRVRALALVGATPCFAERDGWPHGMARGTLAGFAAGLAESRDATLARFVRLNALDGARSREAIRAFTRLLAAHPAPAAPVLAATLAWLEETDLRGEAAAPAPPTLLVHGTRDRLAPVGAARWLAERMPGARLLEIEDAAHLPFFTHREAFDAALGRFLA